MIAHDNAYNNYNIGNLILLDTIEYAINIGITKFNFMWGRCEYKERFKAKYILCIQLLFIKVFLNL